MGDLERKELEQTREQVKSLIDSINERHAIACEYGVVTELIKSSGKPPTSRALNPEVWLVLEALRFWCDNGFKALEVRSQGEQQQGDADTGLQFFVEYVLQPWVSKLSLMQQTVLLTAIRGPDTVSKYHPSKYLLRWYRRCVLYSALDRKILTTPIEAGGGSFTGPSIEKFEQADLPKGAWREFMDGVVDEYMRSLDELPHHFQMHFLHACEIVGYKHPDKWISHWWQRMYVRLVNDLHLQPESEAAMDERLGDNREQWAARNDKATID